MFFCFKQHWRILHDHFSKMILSKEAPRKLWLVNLMSTYPTPGCRCWAWCGAAGKPLPWSGLPPTQPAKTTTLREVWTLAIRRWWVWGIDRKFILELRDLKTPKLSRLLSFEKKDSRCASVQTLGPLFALIWFALNILFRHVFTCFLFDVDDRRKSLTRKNNQFLYISLVADDHLVYFQIFKTTCRDIIQSQRIDLAQLQCLPRGEVWKPYTRQSWSNGRMAAMAVTGPVEYSLN